MATILGRCPVFSADELRALRDIIDRALAPAT
jgi:hypothetical protein